MSSAKWRKKDELQSRLLRFLHSHPSASVAEQARFLKLEKDKYEKNQRDKKQANDTDSEPDEPEEKPAEKEEKPLSNDAVRVYHAELADVDKVAIRTIVPLDHPTPADHQRHFVFVETAFNRDEAEMLRGLVKTGPVHLDDVRFYQEYVAKKLVQTVEEKFYPNIVCGGVFILLGGEWDLLLVLDVRQDTPLELHKLVPRHIRTTRFVLRTSTTDGTEVKVNGEDVPPAGRRRKAPDVSHPDLAYKLLTRLRTFPNTSKQEQVALLQVDTTDEIEQYWKLLEAEGRVVRTIVPKHGHGEPGWYQRHIVFIETTYDRAAAEDLEKRGELSESDDYQEYVARQIVKELDGPDFSGKIVHRATYVLLGGEWDLMMVLDVEREHTHLMSALVPRHVRTCQFVLRTNTTIANEVKDDVTFAEPEPVPVEAGPAKV